MGDTDRIGPRQLPPGQMVDIARRGQVFVRVAHGPPGTPALVLLHGWTATADLNFHPWFRELSLHATVVSFDHRGHGQGIRSSRRFRLSDCADDAVALADTLGLERPVYLGYSMGGAIAQLVWRRHPDKLRGLVLAATAGYFSAERGERLNFLGLSTLAALSRVVPLTVRDRCAQQLLERKLSEGWSDWSIDQLRGSDWTALLEAGHTLGTFSSNAWAASIDVPTAAIVTTRDHVVPPARQLELAGLIPAAAVYRVDGDHGACFRMADEFVATVVQALHGVDAAAR